MSYDLPWQETPVHLSEYNSILYLSGYSKRERFNNIKGAIMIIETMREEISARNRDYMYRTRDQIRKAKIAKGGLFSGTCFLSESVSCTVSCQPTPGSSLASKLQDRIATTVRGDRRVILEEGGNPVSIGLKRKNPFFINGCSFGDSAVNVS